jgi:hypothetical protein
MSRRLGSTLVKLFEYEELVNMCSKIGKILVFTIYFIVITGLPLVDYTSTSQLGALALRTTIILIIALVTWIISRELTKVKTRLERRKTKSYNVKTPYLALLVIVMITAFYFALIFT